MSPPPARAQAIEADLFVESYLSSFASVIKRVSSRQVMAANEILLEAFKRGSWVFIVGNGGSASLASHFACDLEKTACGKHPRGAVKRFHVMSLVDNVATMTAWANDETYDCIFSEPLRARATASDVLVAISASGNSKNIIEAVDTANDLGMSTIGWLGFDGGEALKRCKTSVHVDSDDYGVVEAAHAVIAHLMTSWLTRATAQYRSTPPSGSSAS